MGRNAPPHRTEGDGGMGAILKSSAILSEDGLYRYVLRRKFGLPVPALSEGPCVFVMLNPSTADAEKDDPTIKRCIRFAARFGFAELAVLNLFAIRGTDPKIVRESTSPAGPENGIHFRRVLAEAKETNGDAPWLIAAWGVHGGHRDMDIRAMELFAEEGVVPHALGLTRNGFPRHPLYLPQTAKPKVYEGRMPKSLDAK